MNKTMNALVKQWEKTEDKSLSIEQKIVACCVIVAGLEKARNTVGNKLIALFEESGFVIKSSADLIDAAIKKGIWFNDYPSPRAVKIALERNSKSYAVIGEGKTCTVQYKKAEKPVLYSVVVALAKTCLMLEQRERVALREWEQYRKDFSVAIRALLQATTKERALSCLDYAVSLIRENDDCGNADLFDAMDYVSYLWNDSNNDDDDDDDDDKLVALVFNKRAELPEPEDHFQEYCEMVKQRNAIRAAFCEKQQARILEKAIDDLRIAENHHIRALQDDAREDAVKAREDAAKAIAAKAILANRYNDILQAIAKYDELCDSKGKRNITKGDYADIVQAIVNICKKPL